jgi:hypothetical protein
MLCCPKSSKRQDPEDGNVKQKTKSMRPGRRLALLAADSRSVLVSGASTGVQLVLKYLTVGAKISNERYNSEQAPQMLCSVMLIS